MKKPVMLNKNCVKRLMLVKWLVGSEASALSILKHFHKAILPMSLVAWQQTAVIHTVHYCLISHCTTHRSVYDANVHSSIITATHYHSRRQFAHWVSKDDSVNTKSTSKKDFPSRNTFPNHTDLSHVPISS